VLAARAIMYDLGRGGAGIACPQNAGLGGHWGVKSGTGIIFADESRAYVLLVWLRYLCLDRGCFRPGFRHDHCRPVIPRMCMASFETVNALRASQGLPRTRLTRP